jgi:hypothetical protein
MRKQVIPDHIKNWVDGTIRHFNENVIGDPDAYYRACYRGHSLYLHRVVSGTTRRIARLTYGGSTDNWGFAIYKDAEGRYDADEWIFPGAGHLDGTIDGALKAGVEVHPWLVRQYYVD